jgi:uncharacterized repeat protein (TIGR01451 family)
VITKATVTLNGFSHTFPHDVNVLLVSPSGTNILLMSHTGGGHAANNLTLTFAQNAAAMLPNQAQLVSGAWLPSSYEGPITFPVTAPAPPFGSSLNDSLQGASPNGTWALYVYDDSPGDAGSIATGWSLSLTTAYPINQTADLGVTLTSTPASMFLGQGILTNTITVSNGGPASATSVVVTHTLPPGVSFLSAVPTQTASTPTTNGGTVVTFNISSLAADSSATMTVFALPTRQNPNLTTMASVLSLNDLDLNSGNDVATASIVVLGDAPVMAGLLSSNQFQLTITGESNFTYLIQASTNLHTWDTLTNLSSPNGVIKFADTNSRAFKARYYRAARVSP